MARGRGDRYTQDVFRSLGEREEALIEALTVRQVALPPNRVLVSEGEVGLGLFRITRGWAYRFRRSGNGCRQILDFLMPGEIVGLQEEGDTAGGLVADRRRLDVTVGACQQDTGATLFIRPHHHPAKTGPAAPGRRPRLRTAWAAGS